MRPLFDKLNRAGVRYCVLRNYEELPYSTGGSDVDMWVHVDDLALCEALLKETSKETNMPLVSFYDAPTQYKVCYMGIEDGVQFDIFKGNVYWTNRIMFSGASIEANTIMHGGVKVLSEDFADIQALIKELIYTNDCREKYIDKIYQSTTFTIDYLSKYLECFDVVFLNTLYQAISKKAIKQDIQILGALARKNIKKEHSVSKICYLFSKFKRLKRRPGYVICVEGTDGSGKSFIIESIEPMLNGAFHNKVIYNHLRPNVFPDIAVLFGKRESDKVVKVVSSPHEGKTSGSLVSLLRVSYYMLDYTLGYIKKVLPQINTRYHVFIFDRYFYDYYFDSKRSKVNLPQWILKLFEILVPSPDVILCLGGDPNKIYERKPETSLSEVTRQTEELKRFCNSRNSAFWIDTTLEKEESIKQAMNAIISVMEERFKNINYTGHNK